MVRVLEMVEVIELLGVFEMNDTISIPNVIVSHMSISTIALPGCTKIRLYQIINEGYLKIAACLSESLCHVYV